MENLRNVYRKRGYFAVHGTDVLVSTVLLVACFIFVSRASYTELLAAVRTDWTNQRCNPLYMPFAGAIMPVPGQTAWQTSSKNFDYCTQHDVSSILKTALMPLEYVAFVIIRTIDLLVHAVIASMMFLAYLKSKLGGLFSTTFTKIANFLVPVTLLLVRTRDNLAKMNAVMVTSLFTSMVVYKITISGMLNVMSVIMNLMLVLIGVIVGLFILAAILIATPFTSVLGILLMATTLALVVAVLIPAITMYSLLHRFLADTFGASTADPPKVPKPIRIKKNDKKDDKKDNDKKDNNKKDNDKKNNNKK